MLHDNKTPDDDAVSDEIAAAGAATNEAIRRVLAPFVESQAKILRQTLAPFTTALTRQAEIACSVAAINATQEAVRRWAVQVPQLDLSAITSIQEALRALPTIDFTKIRQAIRRGTPPNWDDLGDNVKFSELFEITETGLPTAWVPRASVLTELIHAAEADRHGVFSARRAETIEDCRAALKDVTSTELVDYVDMLDEALTVAEAGHLAAAQSLAASVFDTILRHTIKPQRIAGYYARVKTEIIDRHENAPVTELRWGLVHVAAVSALQMFNQPQGDPIPATFNRHASAHAVSRVQYTPANAIIALALATSLVREAHQETEDAATTP
jgi:hypothetical protein